MRLVSAGMWLGAVAILDLVRVGQTVGFVWGRAYTRSGRVPDVENFSVSWAAVFHPAVLTVLAAYVLSGGRWWRLAVVVGAALSVAAAAWPPGTDAEILRPGLVVGAAGLVAIAIAGPFGEPDDAPDRPPHLTT
ncbi:MAG TPA: hypothetical protein VIL36_18470 [Acidimicrobiales bacterium]